MSCEELVFPIRQGDTLPSLRALLSDDEGNIPDFDGATTVFQLKTKEHAILFTTSASIFDAVQIDELTGDPYNVEYLWSLGDTDRAPGTYLAEFEVTFAGGEKATFPSLAEDNIIVLIERP